MELDELSGRITGRFGHTWPTTAYAIGGMTTLALRYSIISTTAAAHTRLSDDCEPPGAVGAWASPPHPPGPQDLPRDYGPDGAAGGLSRSTPRRADDTTTRLRERADASVRRPGLGARLLATSDEARAGYDLQFRQRFFLSDNQRGAVSDWRNTHYLSFFLSNGIFLTNKRCGFEL